MFFTKESPIITAVRHLLLLVDGSCLATAFAFFAGSLSGMPLVEGNSALSLFAIFHISYFKHIYTGYKFNKHIVLQFGPVKIKEPNELFTNKLDKNIYI